MDRQHSKERGNLVCLNAIISMIKVPGGTLLKRSNSTSCLMGTGCSDEAVARTACPALWYTSSTSSPAMAPVFVTVQVYSSRRKIGSGGGGGGGGGDGTTPAAAWWSALCASFVLLSPVAVISSATCCAMPIDGRQLKLKVVRLSPVPKLKSGFPV